MENGRQLLGLWKSDPDDDESRSIHGEAVVEFRDDGKVVTTLHPGAVEERKEEDFRVDGNEIVVRDGTGSEKHLSFRLTEDGTLILGLAEGESRYVRLG